MRYRPILSDFTPQRQRPRLAGLDGSFGHVIISGRGWRHWRHGQSGRFCGSPAPASAAWTTSSWLSQAPGGGPRPAGENEGGAGIPQGTSPFSFIHVDSLSGERTIFHRPAAGVERAVLPDLSRIAECDVLLVDDYYPELALAAARAARRAEGPVGADRAVSLRN